MCGMKKGIITIFLVEIIIISFSFFNFFTLMLIITITNDIVCKLYCFPL